MRLPARSPWRLRLALFMPFAFALALGQIPDSQAFPPERPPAPPPVAPNDPVAAIARARGLVARAIEQYQKVRDYRCVLAARERVGGVLRPGREIELEARREPFSVHLRFRAPTPGREVWYVADRDANKIQARDAGALGRLVGVLRLDAQGSWAMDGTRHPVTHAGIGHMLATIRERWAVELSPEESVVAISSAPAPDGRAATLVDVRHTERRPDFLFQRVRVLWDDRTGLPIRFEAYDWPDRPQQPPTLAEAFEFRDLRLDVGLDDRSFDPESSDRLAQLGASVGR